MREYELLKEMAEGNDLLTMSYSDSGRPTVYRVIYNVTGTSEVPPGMSLRDYLKGAICYKVKDQWARVRK